MNFKFKLGVIGYGNMASAIVDNVIKKGVCGAQEILLCDIDMEKLERSGLKYSRQIEDICRMCEYILLSVKPQTSGEVIGKMKLNGNTVISIMAGVNCETIKRQSGAKNVVRCMPNTPCMLAEGAMGLYIGDVSKEAADFAVKMFSSCGKVVQTEEQNLHAVTAISGSAPAYFYQFIHSIIETGVKLGLSYDDAKTLVCQTAIGASKMITSSDEDISLLIDRVCSKGGTTIEAVNHFRENGLHEMVDKAVTKCYNRSRELE